MGVPSMQLLAASGGGPVVYDSFDRPDSTSTMGNADTGQTWTPAGGTVWGISSNAAYAVSGPDQMITVVDSGLADCVIGVTLAVSNNSGLCFRFTDNDNHFVFATAELYRKQSGSYTAVVAFAGFANGDVQTVELDGDSIIVKNNGSTVASFTDSFNQSATKHGLRTFNPATNSRFDNFTIAVP